MSRPDLPSPAFRSNRGGRFDLSATGSEILLYLSRLAGVVRRFQTALLDYRRASLGKSGPAQVSAQRRNQIAGCGRAATTELKQTDETVRQRTLVSQIDRDARGLQRHRVSLAFVAQRIEPRDGDQRGGQPGQRLGQQRR